MVCDDGALWLNTQGEGIELVDAARIRLRIGDLPQIWSNGTSVGCYLFAVLNLGVK